MDAPCRPVAQGLGDAASQFLGGQVGEGHCGNGLGLDPLYLDQMQDTETTAFVELPAPAPDPKKTDTSKESGTCISAGTLPMIRIKNTRGLSVEIFSGTSPEMLCHLIKAFTHAE